MATYPGDPGPRYQALLQVLRTADTLWNCSRVFFARWDLSPSQFNVLNLLSAEGAGLSQIELGRLLIMHRSNVTGLIDRLAARGLVERQEVADDRRAYRIVLTPAGLQLLRKILPEYHRVAEAVWNGFPGSRAKQLALDLERLSGNAQRVSRTPETG
jgi:DNA-binding MarR family transcriptional regulator